MARLYLSSQRRVRDLRFIVTPYRLRDGKYIPDIPDRCPYCNGDGDPCRISKSHERVRATGFGFPLWVVRCQNHGRRAFGLYPPGYGPFLRSPLMAVTPDGLPVRVAEEAPGESAARLPPSARVRLLPTYASAAVDAARGRFWPASTWGAEANTAPRYSTQVRRIRRALRGLGLDPEAENGERLRISQVVGSRLVTTEAIPGKPNQVRGERVCQAFERIGRGLAAVKAVTHAWYLAGLWGLPSYWDSRGGVLRTLPFRRPGTGGAAVS